MPIARPAEPGLLRLVVGRAKRSHHGDGHRALISRHERVGGGVATRVRLDSDPTGFRPHLHPGRGRVDGTGRRLPHRPGRYPADGLYRAGDLGGRVPVLRPNREPLDVLPCLHPDGDGPRVGKLAPVDDHAKPLVCPPTVHGHRLGQCGQPLGGVVLGPGHRLGRGPGPRPLGVAADGDGGGRVYPGDGGPHLPADQEQPSRHGLGARR